MSLIAAPQAEIKEGLKPLILSRNEVQPLKLRLAINRLLMGDAQRHRERNQS
jgi:hypothetical protein